MRTMLISLAAAASALAVAAPASAQVYGSPYGYGAPGYGYGYNSYGYNNYGAGNLVARVAGVRQQIYMLQRQRLIGREQAERLSREARNLERQARYSGYGANPYQMQQLSVRLARLEQRVQFAASRGSRYGYPGYGNGYGYSPYGYSNNNYYGRGDRDENYGRGDRDDDDDYDDDGPDR